MESVTPNSLIFLEKKGKKGVREFDRSICNFSFSDTPA